MCSATESADRPALKPSEIEVTPEMIERGRTAFFNGWSDYPELPISEDTIRNIVVSIFEVALGRLSVA